MLNQSVGLSVWKVTGAESVSRSECLLGHRR